jgi:hypothetical protein
MEGFYSNSHRQETMGLVQGHGGSVILAIFILLRELRTFGRRSTSPISICSCGSLLCAGGGRTRWSDHFKH